jgi:large subunit ribosomal protein L4
MELAIYNTEGKKTSKKVTLNAEVFGVEPNDHAIYLDVKQYMANQRQGTHKTLEKSEISGSTKKLHKQKGTGGSRKGSIKNPLFRGGPRVFGPRPRDYGFKLNKKLKRLARKSALAYKVKDNNFLILEDFSIDTPKTKRYAEILKNLNLQDKKTLLVLKESTANITLSARNLQNTKVVKATDINTYDILKANNLIVVESAIKEIETTLS